MKTCLNLAFAALIALATGNSFAQGFPSKPVRIIVPYAPGGPVDILGRGLGQRLSEVWSQPVVVENRPGANEIIAAEATARSVADGHTLLLATDPVLSQNPFLFAKLPYDARKDLLPVTRLLAVNMALIVPASLPANTAREFVTYMRANGAKTSYGSAGVGNTTHIAMEWFRNIADFPMTHVPYKGLAPALQDMLGGNIQAAFGAVAAVEPHVKTGKLKALAVSGRQRAASLPDVLTFAESGFPNFEANFYMAFVAPAGTPAAVVQKVWSDSRRIMADPAFRARFTDPFAYDVMNENPDEFINFIRKDQELSEKKIRISGVKLEM